MHIETPPGECFLPQQNDGKLLPASQPATPLLLPGRRRWWWRRRWRALPPRQASRLRRRRLLRRRHLRCRGGSDGKPLHRRRQHHRRALRRSSGPSRRRRRGHRLGRNDRHHASSDADNCGGNCGDATQWDQVESSALAAFLHFALVRQCCSSYFVLGAGPSDPRVFLPLRVFSPSLAVTVVSPPPQREPAHLAAPRAEGPAAGPAAAPGGRRSARRRRRGCS